ncbi:hypothetical protein NliqN6_6352 [Naganishia liquefaciens]|uniref:TauD/TfdA-like domain-containing protein n=1 Tax=Naganishia liquefaciens TaxID=104408 RepID=A0A8H3YHG3_9TREE|nr:hypothetical protein NliqN6_6352 [Naganishia liquefaciens]
MTAATQTQTALETLRGAVLPVLPQVASSPKPLQSAGTLEAYASLDLTPSIGTEFTAHDKDGLPSLSIREVLMDPKKLRDLAILVSQRGVVFFRDASITPEEQKDLVEALGQAGGKPAGHGLHVHPLTAETSEFGKEISVISSEFAFDKKFDRAKEPVYTKRNARTEWHSDITFEPAPSDYASLQIREFPAQGGGDTLWASGYELYDRLTPTYRKFLEGLTAEHRGDFFVAAAKAKGEPLRGNRGSPLNDNQDLKASHPVIRVNPVTGWKSLFVNGVFTKKVNELNDEESENLLKFLSEHVHANFDAQVRYRWEPNNLAIWDNRSTFHAATKDFDRESGSVRTGTRSVSIGERPYFDSNAVSRREAIAAGQAAGLTRS